jgi:hypothetical protein
MPQCIPKHNNKKFKKYNKNNEMEKIKTEDRAI